MYNKTICFVAACTMGPLQELLRKPPLHGQIAAGGPNQSSGHRNKVMIGLKIDLHKMVTAGKWVIAPGLLQFPICTGLSYVVLRGLDEIGIDVGAGSYAQLYCAIAIS